MDAIELLRKYIEHVGNCEGICFLRDCDRTDGFTDDEWAELQRVANEVRVSLDR